MPKNNVIYGCPGAGKTEHLLGLIEAKLASGVPPHKIAYMSFSKKAVEEGKERAMAKFKLSATDLPWFRTLHSVCYHAMGLNRTNMMGWKNYKEIFDTYPIGVPYSAISGVTFDAVERGAGRPWATFDVINSFARQTMLDQDRAWIRMFYVAGVPKIKGTKRQYDYYCKVLEEYKYDNGLYDFTDLLERFVRDACPCPVDYAFVDEAQDLTPLQWAVVETAFQGCKEVYIAGDDDQAIYSWNGADVNKFISLSKTHHMTILNHSHRVPAAIHQSALDVLGQIRSRVPKDWTHNGQQGELHLGSTPLIQDMSGNESWLLLARDNVQLDIFKYNCEVKGLLYKLAGENSVHMDNYRAILLWERLRRGESILVSEAIHVYNAMHSNVGYANGGKKKLKEMNPQQKVCMHDLKTQFNLMHTAIWHDALTRIPPKELSYYHAVLRNGEKLTAKPRITISTIHGAKGGEADNVIFNTAVTKTSYDNLSHKDDYDGTMRDMEYRLCYVAMTRAKKRLFAPLPNSKYGFVITNRR